MHDVVVVGAGPAGLAVAAECAARGVDVVVVAPAPDAPWRPTYGCWVDEVPSGLEGCLRRSWDDVIAVGRRRHELGRSYGVFDNAALQGRLRAAAGDAFVPETVSALMRGPGGVTTVVGVGGAVLWAWVVVDAAGHGSLTMPRDPAIPRIEQCAFGIVARFDRPPIPPDRCVLMDWTGPRADPTFLYGFDLGNGEQFVEETSLARRPGLSQAALRRRLRQRLHRLGVEPVEVRSEEVVRIPMDTPVPSSEPNVVGFGAAGGFVHPVSGYSVATSLRLAPRLAEALASGASARECHRVLWPVGSVQARALHRWGLQAIVGMDGDDLRALFDAFFDLPRNRWSAYLGADASPGRVAGAMAAVFRRAPWSLRRRLALPLPSG